MQRDRQKDGKSQEKEGKGHKRPRRETSHEEEKSAARPLAPVPSGQREALSSSSDSDGKSSEAGGETESVCGSALLDSLLGSKMSVFLESLGMNVLTHEIEDEETYVQIENGFFHGDLRKVLVQSRDDTNRCPTSDDIENLSTSFDNRETVSVPFVFTDLACKLREALAALLDYRFPDMEVGMYFSKAGGAPKEFHVDTNHNLTVQLYGEKQWRIMPGCPSIVCNRSVKDEIQTRLDRETETPQNPSPPLSSSPPTPVCTYTLRPGSLIYVPPGFWHSVAPVSGASIVSIDFRFSEPPACKSISEALFTELFLYQRKEWEEGRRPSPERKLKGTRGQAAASHSNFSSDCSTRAAHEEALALLDKVKSTPDETQTRQPSLSSPPRSLSVLSSHDFLASCLQRNPPLRSLPSEPERSDGFLRAVSLSVAAAQLRERGLISPAEEKGEKGGPRMQISAQPLQTSSSSSSRRKGRGNETASADRQDSLPTGPTLSSRRLQMHRLVSLRVRFVCAAASLLDVCLLSTSPLTATDFLRHRVEVEVSDQRDAQLARSLLDRLSTASEGTGLVLSSQREWAQMSEQAQTEIDLLIDILVFARAVIPLP
uniref:JmjC domain-containing protein n=1 Tax=Chromera velia CCMP2878 TaxID=1169474 RepID=A0A0G4HJQ6_9ALVE|eukprot:Cvel_7152.t1-p1 / transcript=Cvel_7152.t1 / gene=Cvel_7152 / organism=Chromera_velia_CCMP2878 / gene_product=hypothetical protein / transcript_product=hypothetical protein / location=Cvel_scaffold368:18481-20277(-) / protein_length=599 / sequence_SO=supercontig / SO=protein_coding / is_pseudo=false